MTAKLMMIGLGAVLLAAATAAPASADNAEWQTVLREARGQTLSLAVQPIAGMQETVRRFQAAHPEINVRVTVQSPTRMAPRIIAEQQNGIYSWDSWWAISSNMNDVVLPAGGFDKITDYFVLDDIKDSRTWRVPTKDLYSSKRGPYIFLESMSVDQTVLRNLSVVRDLKIRTLNDLLDPRLKGKIAIRDPSRPNGGTFGLASMLQQGGSEFIHRLFTEMDPVFIENNQQLTVGLLRGDYAVAIGTARDIYVSCKQGGGCRDVEQLPFGYYIFSYGLAVLKNAPHPAATKVWVNWLLSREGQQAFVQSFAQQQSGVGSSMRRDVDPDPRQMDTIPDFTRLASYTAPAIDRGAPYMRKISKMYREVRRTSNAGRFDARRGALYALICCASVALIVFIAGRCGNLRRAPRPRARGVDNAPQMT